MATQNTTSHGGGTTGTPTQQAGSGTQQSGFSAGIDPEAENDLLNYYLLVVLGALTIILVAWRLSTELLKYVRTVTSLNNNQQRYYAIASSNVSWFKKNVLYAPIFRKRHSREFQVSSAVNVGTLPTRMQLVFLLGYFATNVAFCVIDIPFSSKTAANILRNRSGTLAVVNMIPLFLMAGRNNPLIRLLNMPFDTFNLLHRWLGRIVVLESIVHTLAYLIPAFQDKGVGATFQSVFKSKFMLYGFISTCAAVAIAIQAGSVLRHAFYETFKLLHMALAALLVATLWYHLGLAQLIQIKYLYGVIALWAFDHLARWLRLAYCNVGAGGTKTLVEALPGNACRVTVSMARPWTFKPGQHAYLYMPSVGFWQSHPFSVAWSEEAERMDGEKLPMDRQDVLAMTKTSMSFVIRARTGFTNALYRKAADCKDGKLLTRAFVEGPYGGRHMMHSYGTVMLVAGGVGITQAVPHVRDLVVGYSNNTVAARKVVLVWIIQSPEHLEWIRPWMTEILAMEKRRDVLRIMLFVSRPRSTKEIHSPSATVQMFPGRPNIDTLLAMEMEQQIGTLGVSVCGPGSLADEVRRAVRNRQYQGAIDFVEESFSW